jgi:pseudouridine kinase
LSRPDRAAPAVVCVGGAVLDRTLRLLAAPVPGTSNPARMATGAGGVARNVAENLARMAVPVALVSRVGDDASGQELLAGLDRLGVDRSGVRVVPGAVTAQYVALLDPDGELVVAAAAMDLFDGFAPDDVAPDPPDAPDRGPLAGVPSSGVVFAEANLPAQVLARLVRWSGRAGAGRPRLVLDAVSTAKAARLPADLAGVAVLIGNADELRAWLVANRHPGAGGPADLVARVLAAGRPGAVVGTVGADGAWVADASGVTALPAEPATVVDVTGAGDALVAGTVAGLVAGRPLREAVALGIGRAARTVTVPGSVLPDDEWGEPVEPDQPGEPDLLQERENR